MQFTKTRLFAAVLALSLPAAASFAQAPSAGVVLPPQMPGAAAPAPAAVPVAPRASAPVVLPPASATSANPAAMAPTAPPQLIDIAIPAAPKPDAPKAGADLKPAAPKAAAPAKAKPKKPVEEVEVTRTKASVDPFAGIVGTPVSDSQINRFTFPEAVEGVFFQEGSPLPECADGAGEMDPCKPVFLNGKRLMLLQLRAGAKGPVQMLVHLKSGRLETFNLMPAAGPGAVIRLDGAEDGASDARLAEGRSAKGAKGVSNAAGMTASEQNVEMLARFARGDIPAGFESVAVVNKPVRFELFDVVQQASWENGAGLRAHLFQVRAHGATPVAISPALFRNEGVKALALDRETITNKEPALLYLLELVPTEAN